MKWVSERLEIHAGLGALAAALSIAIALFVYAAVQTWAQVRLAEAYGNAEFEGPFCDDHVALDGEQCRQSTTMSWQQIYTLLSSARVIDTTEQENCAKLEEEFNTGEAGALEDLLKTLRNGTDEPSRGECTNSGPTPAQASQKEEKPAQTNAPDGAKNEISEAQSGPTQPQHEGQTPATVTRETALGLIVRLAGEQCEETDTSDEREKKADPTQHLKNNLSFALADALGHEDLFADRCEAARADLKGIRTDDFTADPPSGWRFSSGRCLSDALILGRLVDQHRAIGSQDDEIVGYNLNGCGIGPKLQPHEALDRFEAFTTLMEYVIGRVHAGPSVREARKIANLVRGPEHIAIVSVALLASLLAGVRLWAFQQRYAQAVRRVDNEETRALRRLAAVLAKGGDEAEREHEALARGRVRIQWSLATIPALGFIGTVRGILEALSQAGDVVWAADRLERADAIAQLSGELGLAFSTTLFALLAGIAVGLFVTMIRVREGRCLDRLADFGQHRVTLR